MNFFRPESCVLIVIDLQGNLAHCMHDKDVLIKNISSVIKAAKTLNIPIIYTEQVPDKIGPTIEEIKQHLADIEPITKQSFSCCGENTFLRKLGEQYRSQVILIGIEAHVCVFQTAYDLLQKSYEVQVVSDAVSSRSLENKLCALRRLAKLGVDETTTEMLITELLRTAQHPQFKEIHQLMK